MQKPSPARIVLAVGAKAQSNGTDTAPAIITRVWSEKDDVWLVNATVLPDATDPVVATSVYLYADEEAARGSLQNEYTTALYWPPRV